MNVCFRRFVVEVLWGVRGLDP